MLTSEQLKEIRERAEKNITITFKDYDTANEAEKRNRQHITAARTLISTDIPALLSHIEEVEKEGDVYFPITCPKCKGRPYRSGETTNVGCSTCKGHGRLYVKAQGVTP